MLISLWSQLQTICPLSILTKTSPCFGGDFHSSCRLLVLVWLTIIALLHSLCASFHLSTSDSSFGKSSSSLSTRWTFVRKTIKCMEWTITKSASHMRLTCSHTKLRRKLIKRALINNISIAIVQQTSLFASPYVFC